ncbi:MAG: FAD:protein FMN transferase [Acidimicrobiia bacterium]|nr:FAD:protein FMN transferase [Acidimicrobiia bacterium]
MAVVEHRFRVMASEAHVVLVEPTAGAIDVAVARLHELEQRWSRFVPGSDIDRLAGAGGNPQDVSNDTLLLLHTMRQAHRGTSGRFDPTMLREIIDVGYAASIDNPARVSTTINLPFPSGTIDDVELDGTTVRLPEGMALDPGGIGKGLAADIVCAELIEAGTAGALVSIGGDLAAAGGPPSSAGWMIAVEDPYAPGAELLTVGINAGGVATSSTLSRSWRLNGRPRHHLLDPRTGTSARTDLVAVTVFAPSAWEAEVHATTALIAGGAGAIDHLNGLGMTGIAIDRDGTMHSTNQLSADLTKVAS